MKNSTLVGVLLCFFISVFAMPLDAQTPPVEAAQHRLKVGVTICEWGATGPSWLGTPYGYGQAREVIRQLRDTSVDVIPVIEPDTEAKVETKAVLDQLFKDQKTLSMYDAKALQNLDVLVVVNCWGIHQEALDAIEAAAKDGLHLIVVSGVGIAAPETNEQTQRIAGIEGSIYGWNPKAVRCVVTKPHPILGDLKEGAEILLCPNGMFGNLKDVSTLVRVASMDDIHVPERKKKEEEMALAPVYISKLGKGQIVGVGWAAWKPLPEAIEDATDGRFYERAVLWLAGRPLPAKEQRDADLEKYGVRLKHQGGKADAPVVEVDFARANLVEDAVLRQLAGFEKLERVYLRDASSISDTGVKTLASLGSLKTLLLSGSKMTDAGVAELKGLKQLRWLDLSGSTIGDESVEHLKALNQLQNLFLRKTVITEAGFKDLQETLPNCRITP
jgi:hypothetical protein